MVYGEIVGLRKGFKEERGSKQNPLSGLEALSGFLSCCIVADG